MRREACIEETGLGINLCLIALAALEDFVVGVVGSVIRGINEIVIASGCMCKVDDADDNLAALLLFVLGDGGLAIEWVEEQIVRMGSPDDFSGALTLFRLCSATTQEVPSFRGTGNRCGIGHRTFIVTLDIAIAIIDEQQTASVESKPFETVDDLGECRQLLQQKRDVVG